MYIISIHSSCMYWHMPLRTIRAICFLVWFRNVAFADIYVLTLCVWSEPSLLISFKSTPNYFVLRHGYIIRGKSTAHAILPLCWLKHFRVLLILRICVKSRHNAILMYGHVYMRYLYRNCFVCLAVALHLFFSLLWDALVFCRDTRVSSTGSNAVYE